MVSYTWTLRVARTDSVLVVIEQETLVPGDATPEFVLEEITKEIHRQAVAAMATHHGLWELGIDQPTGRAAVVNMRHVAGFSIEVRRTDNSAPQS